ncbi:iron-sulfur cluster repair di-iron protein [Rubripirellula tenax]|uniref:Iron-sulfur cluster repair di-iron protein n=2 Tax=Rubripirellula tenax TaxID=2528015 RepID=A0A5C6ELS7_9BACT|nr:iron-sulfur cluster repair di-iron protein [Rubripirellula tenax]
MRLADLADRIEKSHCDSPREELARLDFMTENVARVHRDKKSHLTIVREAFVDQGDELESHVIKEEKILFPQKIELEEETQ